MPGGYLGGFQGVTTNPWRVPEVLEGSWVVSRGCPGDARWVSRVPKDPWVGWGGLKGLSGLWGCHGPSGDRLVTTVR